MVETPGVLGNDRAESALTAILQSGPMHGAVELAADGSFRYTPSPGYVGGDGFSYRACTSAGVCASARVVLRVRARVLAERLLIARSGGFHTCGLTVSGGVQCWGYNGNGQLGDDSQRDGITRVDVVDAEWNPVSGAVALATGDHHACFLDRAGTARCWGRNWRGQLGDDSARDWPTPIEVRDQNGNVLTGLVAIDAGSEHSCALDEQGRVWCWGDSRFGKRGQGHGPVPSGATLVVADQGPLTDIASITVGSHHACAATVQGAAYCWGFNGHGQLGNGGGHDQHQALPVMRTPDQPLGDVVSLSAGALHTCALTGSGNALCWGYGGGGRLGNADAASNGWPVPVVRADGTLLAGIVDLSAGGAHTCAVLDDGALYCWGYNVFGQLGDGSQIDRPVPVPVVDSTGMPLVGQVAVDAGTFHTCALNQAGIVACWGLNNRGQLGDGERGGYRTKAR